jgi:hypothetical protein
VLDCDGVAVGVAVVVFDDEVQPAIDNKPTITSMIIANNFFSIQFPPDGKMNQRGQKAA